MSDDERNLKYEMEKDSEIAKPQCDGKEIKQICDNPEVNNLSKDEPTNSIAGYDEWSEQISSMEDLNELPIVGETDMEFACVNEHFKSKEKETISIKDDNGKEYKFEKPEFEIKLFFIDEDIHGVAESGQSFYSCEWSKFTGSLMRTTLDRVLEEKEYDLTPIKPKWYEDENNFPALMISGDTNITLRKANNKDDVLDDIGDGFRLVTKEEVNSLHYQDKE